MARKKAPEPEPIDVEWLEATITDLAAPIFVWRMARALVDMPISVGLTTGRKDAAQTRVDNALTEIDTVMRAYVRGPRLENSG